MKDFIYNTIGEPMKIIEYNSYQDITALFLDTNTIVKQREYGKFLKGQIKNPEHPCVFNIGYLGIGEFHSFENGRIIPSYQALYDMLKRVYGNSDKSRFYSNCKVCEEWHNFQNFAKWYYNNYYTIDNYKMELDKDIIVKRNRTYYPDNCVFVPDFINKLFTKNCKNRNNLPIGVSICVNKYKARCGGKYLGLFSDKYNAFLAYKNEKEYQIKNMADKYKDEIPEKLYIALYNYKVEYSD